MKISNNIIEGVNNTQAKWISKISKIPEERILKGIINLEKPIEQLKVVEKYLQLQGKIVLEVGSGIGINLLSWIKQRGIDGYGIEPEGEGFDSSYKLSQTLFEENGEDPKRIINAVAEHIPFKDDTFDFVYSTNVIEHVDNPELMIKECLRVAKPGSFIQIVFPNYHSFFDGHYAVFHPPIFFKRMFPLIIKWIYRRDPSFAETINADLNYWRIKKILNKNKKIYDHEVVSYGKEVFLYRVRTLKIQEYAGMSIAIQALKFLKRIKLNVIIGYLVCWLKMYTPIIITIKKH